MMATHRADAAGGRHPVTPGGRYLRATAVNDRVDELHEDSARNIFARAFVSVVRLRFLPDTPLVAIARSVKAAARRHPALAVRVREAEMLIREALGECVPTAGITTEQAMAVHVLLFASLVDELALTDDELDELIADAERGF